MRIANTTIANAGDDGIAVFTNNKDVTIANTTIRDAQNGLHIFGSGNEVTMNDSTLAGMFVNGILIDNFAVNTSLNGTGNTAANATFGGNLCEDNGNAWTGTVVFDGVAITNANCP